MDNEEAIKFVKSPEFKQKICLISSQISELLSKNPTPNIVILAALLKETVTVVNTSLIDKRILSMLNFMVKDTLLKEINFEAKAEISFKLEDEKFCDGCPLHWHCCDCGVFGCKLEFDNYNEIFVAGTKKTTRPQVCIDRFRE